MEADNNNEPAKAERPQFHITFKIALVLSAICLLCSIVAILLAANYSFLMIQIAYAIMIPASFAGLLSVIYYAIALFMSQRPLSIFAVGLISFVVLIGFGSQALSEIHANRYPAMCQENLKSLSQKLLKYKQTHENRVPDTNWCDVLLKFGTKKGIKTFACWVSATQPDQSSYALNKNLIGFDLTKANREVVLLFECKLPEYDDLKNNPVQQGITWNQVGDANNLVRNHDNGCNIAFVNGQIKYIKAEDIPKLRWNP